ncbi:hypothetical protein TTRE_0000824001 [Trichuris trichiura]|uniref:Uncharacterized protein n=1 Tax=Trichuris trichiura TaxID=36087 RepID=A0A077ZHR1_TRITR|nr:hypothetical protein TTRE_0000824001 [Trichuris trichiura]
MALPTFNDFEHDLSGRTETFRDEPLMGTGMWRALRTSPYIWNKRDVLVGPGTEEERSSWKKNKLWGYGKAVWG